MKHNKTIEDNSITRSALHSVPHLYDLFEIFIQHEPSFRDSAHSTRQMGERLGYRRDSHDG